MLLAITALPVAGQDVTGTWLATVDLGPGGGGQVTLVLEQDGTAVSGTYTGSYGTGVELSGTARGGRIGLSFPSDDVGEITYEGVVAAPDSMSGRVRYGTRYEGTFEALRRPPVTVLSTAVGYGVLTLLVALALGMILRGLR